MKEDILEQLVDGERGRWEGDPVRPLKIETESEMNSVVVITATRKPDENDP